MPKKGRKDGIKMVAALFSFGTAFILAGIAEGLYALAERAKDRREHKAIKELYERRMYRCGR